jgi:hypothetical protein
MKQKEQPQTTGTTLFEQSKGKQNPIRYIKSRAVKSLEAMADQAARAKYPDTPAHFLAPRKFRDDAANSLTNCIIQFLQLSGHQSERISNTGRRIDTRTTFKDVTGQSRTIGGSHWIKGTGCNGSSDISSTIAGRSVKIEVKCAATKDRQSEAQKKYQLSIEQAGGLYVIATTFEGFLTWYNQTITDGKN